MFPLLPYSSRASSLSVFFSNTGYLFFRNITHSTAVKNNATGMAQYNPSAPKSAGMANIIATGAMKDPNAAMIIELNPSPIPVKVEPVTNSNP